MRAPNQKAAVVGAGLVGSLWSIYLARLGFNVDVYERRPDLRKEAISAGRSINLAISLRGLNALSKLGLDQEALRAAIPMRGRMVHPLVGEPTLQPYGKDDSEHINSISRGWLNGFLMEQAERAGVRFHFNRRLEDGNGLDAEWIFGTDGAHSSVRAALEREGKLTASESRLDYGYKELTIPAGEDGRHQLFKHALHIWPRGAYMLIALPNLDGSFTCTLFLAFEGATSFASLSDERAVTAFFREQFPDASALMPELPEQFFGNPTGQMVTVKCGPWTDGGKTLLLGDAAHAIVPFFGQGMNCGFEDCAVLADCLDGGKIGPGLFADFFELRKQNADAIAEMALENFIEMRDKVADPRFLLYKKIEAKLTQAFPGEYISRYRLVTFTRVPYRLALEIGLRQDEILAELTRGGISSAETVDMEKARELIQGKLHPLMARAISHGP